MSKFIKNRSNKISRYIKKSSYSSCFSAKQRVLEIGGNRLEDFSSMEGKTRHQLWMDLCDLVREPKNGFTNEKSSLKFPTVDELDVDMNLILQSIRITLCNTGGMSI